MPKAKCPEELCLVPRAEGKCNYPISEERRCKNHAGWKTTHPGVGCCVKHAGSGRPIIHGKRSKFNISSPLQDMYEEFLNDPDWKSLREEAAVARVHLADLEENEDAFDSKEAFLRSARDLLTLIATLVEKGAKIEDGETYNVNVQQMTFLLNRLVVDIESICGDCPRVAKLAEKIGNVDLITAPRLIEADNSDRGQVS